LPTHPSNTIPEPWLSFLRELDLAVQDGNPEREDLTLRLWIAAIEEERSG